MKIKYYVITKIGEGNYHTIMGVKKGKDIIFNDNLDFRKYKKIAVAKHVTFELGELLVIDEETGREGDWGRSPRKWDIEWKEFDDVETAMMFSNKIIKRRVSDENI